ncbi:MAG: DUF362 domain-containing protein [Terracidiphilus sp.]
MPASVRDAVVYHDPKLLDYSVRAPFSPSTAYPEYLFHDSGMNGANSPYQAVREFLHLAGFDSANYGRAEWNPWGELIRPGNKVVIKPNFVLHENNNAGSIESLVTHGSLIRAVVDYVLIALKGQGSVVIGDAPLQSCRFDVLRRLAGLDEVMAYYTKHASVPVSLVDFRCEYAVTAAGRGLIVKVERSEGEPSGYRTVDFAQRSMLAPVSEKYERFRVTNYDPKLMSQHHNREKHEYLVSGSVLNADVVISIPKMKTHAKAGVTGALKNCVGINGHKDWLPHHTKGPATGGGDEYAHPSILKSAQVTVVETKDVVGSRVAKEFLGLTSFLLHGAGRRLSKDPYFEGSWYGNDTIWRTVLDLNRALVYADNEGILRDTPQRRTFFLIDGIIAGEGEGPLHPDPKPAGLLIGAYDAPVADLAMARLMGFDYRRIPSVREAFKIQDLPLVECAPEDVEILSNSEDLSRVRFTEPGFDFAFRPSRGWRGKIEMVTESSLAASR